MLQSDVTSTFEFEPIQGFPMLNWRGKRPFASTQFYPAQRKEAYGLPVNGWSSKIFWGDNLQVMSNLLASYRGAIDLVYIDPPFDSRADYKKKIELRGKHATSTRSAFEEKQYTDIWTNDEYLQFMYERILLIKELMSERASIYLHCDYRKSHFLKLMLDEIFGPDRFQNEIVWLRTNAHNMPSKGYVRSNDHILYYTKSKTFTFNEQYSDMSAAQRKRYKADENGELYTGQDLTFSGVNPDRQFNWRGTIPSATRSWGLAFEDLEKLWEQKLILVKRDGTPRLDGYKVFLKDKEGKGNALTCNWTDISRVSNTGDERLDYPTQKPEALIERILAVSSNPGDLVFDCFMGSGTVPAVAMQTGRRFIGADINLGAIQTTTRRLLDLTAASSTGNEECPHFCGFEVYNVNQYDVFRNPAQARDLLVEALGIQRSVAGAAFDGELDGRVVKIMPINRIATRADLAEIVASLDYKTLERRRNELPAGEAVERLLLVCMGHEPALKSELLLALQPYKVDVAVVDILRDAAFLQFNRDSEASVVVNDELLSIEAFFPMNLLQRLGMEGTDIENWRDLVDSVMIDWNYDGDTLRPTVIDLPADNGLVSGVYDVPRTASIIRVKITDLLSESWENNVGA